MIEKNEFKDALDFYDKLSEMAPSTGIYRRKGNILFALCKFEESRESYEQSLKLDDENLYAYLGRGKLYLIEGDYKKAYLVFKELVEKFPRHQAIFRILFPLLSKGPYM